MNKSRIDTCDHSFSPVKGCNNIACHLHPVHKGEGPGAGKCWAAAMCKRMAGVWAESEAEFRNKDKIFPIGSNILYQKIAENFYNFKPIFLKSIFLQPFPRKASRIAVLYMTDFAFIPEEWVQHVIDKIKQDNQERQAAGLRLHQFLWLTKSPQAYGNFEWPSNCWLGFTATTQNEYDKRYAAIRSVSVKHDYPKTHLPIIYAYIEPIREEVDISYNIDLDWVIVGGGDTPVHPDWIFGIIKACLENKIPVFFKKWDKWIPTWDPSQKKYVFNKARRGEKSDVFLGKRYKQFPEVKNG